MGNQIIIDRNDLEYVNDLEDASAIYSHEGAINIRGKKGNACEQERN